MPKEILSLTEFKQKWEEYDAEQKKIIFEFVVAKSRETQFRDYKANIREFIEKGADEAFLDTIEEAIAEPVTFKKFIDILFPGPT